MKSVNNDDDVGENGDNDNMIVPKPSLRMWE